MAKKKHHLLSDLASLGRSVTRAGNVASAGVRVAEHRAHKVVKGQAAKHQPGALSGTLGALNFIPNYVTGRDMISPTYHGFDMYGNRSPVPNKIDNPLGLVSSSAGRHAYADSYSGNSINDPGLAIHRRQAVSNMASKASQQPSKRTRGRSKGNPRGSYGVGLGGSVGASEGTFGKGLGNVGSTGSAGKSASSALDAAVRAIIAGNVQPIEAERLATARQAALEMQYGQGADTALQSQLAQIGQDQNGLQAGLQGLAGGRSPEADQAHAAQQAYLESQLGKNFVGTGNQQVAQAGSIPGAQSAAEGFQRAAGYGLLGQAQHDYIGQNRANEAVKGRDFQRARRLQSVSDIQALRAQIAAERAKAPTLKYQMGLDQAAAEAAGVKDTFSQNLQLAKMAQDQNQFESTLGLHAAQLAAGAKTTYQKRKAAWYKGMDSILNGKTQNVTQSVVDPATGKLHNVTNTSQGVGAATSIAEAIKMARSQGIPLRLAKQLATQHFYQPSPNKAQNVAHNVLSDVGNLFGSFG